MWVRGRYICCVRACVRVGKKNLMRLKFSGTAYNNANTSSVASFGNSSPSNGSSSVVAISSSFIDTAVPTIPIISPTTNDKEVDVRITSITIRVDLNTSRIRVNEMTIWSCVGWGG